MNIKNINNKISLPDGNKKLLLHVCCAPCSARIIERLLTNEIEVTIFFYNPNIHPRKEYEKRKHEVIHFLDKIKIPWIEGDYDTHNWSACTYGMGSYPEKSIRCEKCFTLRLRKTAYYAHKLGFKIFATSLAISRWKDINQITRAGHLAANEHNLLYFDYNWRKHRGEEQAVQVAKREKFYGQKYCGCIFSKINSNNETI